MEHKDVIISRSVLPHKAAPLLAFVDITKRPSDAQILRIQFHFIKPKETKTPSIRPIQQREEVFACGDDELVLLYSSKDVVKISQIEEALHMRGIDFTVLDRHGATIMSFLPEVEIRIMVQKRDFERSSLILNEISGL